MFTLKDPVFQTLKCSSALQADRHPRVPTRSVCVSSHSGVYATSVTQNARLSTLRTPVLALVDYLRAYKLEDAEADEARRGELEVRRDAVERGDDVAAHTIVRRVEHRYARARYS
jgi:hypothetical protein